MFNADDETRTLMSESESHPLTKRKRRQLSIKGVDEKTFELARAAAERRGLRVSAWIRMELHEAGMRALYDQPAEKPEMDGQVLRALVEQFEELRSKQQQEKSVLETKLDEIKQDVTNIIKFQHGMIAKTL